MAQVAHLIRTYTDEQTLGLKTFYPADRDPDMKSHHYRQYAAVVADTNKATNLLNNNDLMTSDERDAVWLSNDVLVIALLWGNTWLGFSTWRKYTVMKSKTAVSSSDAADLLFYGVTGTKRPDQKQCLQCVDSIELQYLAVSKAATQGKATGPVRLGQLLTIYGLTQAQAFVPDTINWWTCNVLPVLGTDSKDKTKYINSSLVGSYLKTYDFKTVFSTKTSENAPENSRFKSAEDAKQFFATFPPSRYAFDLGNIGGTTYSLADLTFSRNFKKNKNNPWHTATWLVRPFPKPREVSKFWSAALPSPAKRESKQPKQPSASQQQLQQLQQQPAAAAAAEAAQSVPRLYPSITSTTTTTVSATPSATTVSRPSAETKEAKETQAIEAYKTLRAKRRSIIEDAKTEKDDKIRAHKLRGLALTADDVKRLPNVRSVPAFRENATTMLNNLPAFVRLFAPVNLWNDADFSFFESHVGDLKKPVEDGTVVAASHQIKSDASSLDSFDTKAQVDSAVIFYLTQLVRVTKSIVDAVQSQLNEFVEGKEENWGRGDLIVLARRVYEEFKVAGTHQEERNQLAAVIQTDAILLAERDIMYTLKSSFEPTEDVKEAKQILGRLEEIYGRLKHDRNAAGIVANAVYKYTDYLQRMSAQGATRAASEQKRPKYPSDPIYASLQTFAAAVKSDEKRAIQDTVAVMDGNDALAIQDLITILEQAIGRNVVDGAWRSYIAQGQAMLEHLAAEQAARQQQGAAQQVAQAAMASQSSEVKIAGRELLRAAEQQELKEEEAAEEGDDDQSVVEQVALADEDVAERAQQLADDADDAVRENDAAAFEAGRQAEEAFVNEEEAAQQRQQAERKLQQTQRQAAQNANLAQQAADVANASAVHAQQLSVQNPDNPVIAAAAVSASSAAASAEVKAGDAKTQQQSLFQRTTTQLLRSVRAVQGLFSSGSSAEEIKRQQESVALEAALERARERKRRTRPLPPESPRGAASSSTAPLRSSYSLTSPSFTGSQVNSVRFSEEGTRRVRDLRQAEAAAKTPDEKKRAVQAIAAMSKNKLLAPLLTQDVAENKRDVILGTMALMYRTTGAAIDEKKYPGSELLPKMPTDIDFSPTAAQRILFGYTTADELKARVPLSRLFGEKQWPLVKWLWRLFYLIVLQDIGFDVNIPKEPGKPLKQNRIGTAINVGVADKSALEELQYFQTQFTELELYPFSQLRFKYVPAQILQVNSPPSSASSASLSGRGSSSRTGAPASAPGLGLQTSSAAIPSLSLDDI